MERIAEGKALLLRIVEMLTKLVDRFEAYRAREGEEPDAPNLPLSESAVTRTAGQ